MALALEFAGLRDSASAITARAAVGHAPPLGFLNPLLYSNASGLNDIVTGRNDAGTGLGFNATKGFDCATGLGTINFPKLVAMFG